MLLKVKAITYAEVLFVSCQLVVVVERSVGMGDLVEQKPETGSYSYFRVTAKKKKYH
jgi:hypothetical protein